MVEILKQPPYSPLSIEKQVCIIFAGANGFLDDMEVSKITKFEEELHQYIETNHSGILEKLKETKKLDEVKDELSDAITKLKSIFISK
jgi:F-type H+-transporting ATPase subunit alpha